MPSDAAPLAGRVFVDTNVFLYARDDRFPEKQAMARHWLEVLADRGLIVVSPQVLGELHAVILHRHLPIDPEDARQTKLALEEWSEGATDLALVGDAWSLQEQTRFQWWDCVILGSAIRARCRFLLSEDYQHGHKVEGTTIVNPFRALPKSIFANS